MVFFGGGREVSKRSSSTRRAWKEGRWCLRIALGGRSWSWHVSTSARRHPGKREWKKEDNERDKKTDFGGSPFSKPSGGCPWLDIPNPSLPDSPHLPQAPHCWAALGFIPRRIYFARILKRKKEKKTKEKEKERGKKKKKTEKGKRKGSFSSPLAKEAAKADADGVAVVTSLYQAQRTGVQYGKSPSSEEEEEEGSPTWGRSAVH